MTRIRSIEFNTLPMPVRRRLAASLQGKCEPKPILAVRSSLLRALAGWAVAGAVCAAAGLSLFFAGFGELRATGAIQSSTTAFAYVVVVLCSVHALLGAIRRFAMHRALPYPGGIYLYATDLVDARTATLRILPMTLCELTVARDRPGPGRQLLDLRFEDGTAFAFPFDGHGAERIRRDLREARAQLDQHVAKGDGGAVRLDPFFYLRARGQWHERVSSPLNRAGCRAAALPGFLDRRWLVALVLAVAGGPVLARFRNARSDDAAHESALDSAAREGDPEPAAPAEMRARDTHRDDVIR